MANYAQATTVPVEKSRMEIEQTLTRFGAEQFNYAHDHAQGKAMVQFCAKERQVRFMLTLPDKKDREFTLHKKGYQQRTPEAAYKLWEQACRQRWRALALCIKAKLAAVEAGITEFEDEFLAHIVLPGNRTVAHWLRPQLEQLSETGEMPRSLLALPDYTQTED